VIVIMVVKGMVMVAVRMIVMVVAAIVVVAVLLGALVVVVVRAGIVVVDADHVRVRVAVHERAVAMFVVWVSRRSRSAGGEAKASRSAYLPCPAAPAGFRRPGQRRSVLATPTAAQVSTTGMTPTR
jgi:hypothetical protein